MWMCLLVLLKVAAINPVSTGMGVSVSCTAVEYEVKEQCCRMCNPGYHVYRHCTEHTSTTCAPCPTSTYTDAQSGLEACRRCTVCNSSAGVNMKRECSSTSDTLCEPLQGHYCSDPIQDGCRGAVEHTKCKPGQFIKQPGTAYTDTVCFDCDSKTFSDGTFRSCKPHSQCELGYYITKEGTSSSDTECQMLLVPVMIAVTLLVVILVVTAVTVTAKVRIRRRVKKKRKETYGNNMERKKKDPEYVLMQQIPCGETENLGSLSQCLREI